MTIDDEIQLQPATNEDSAIVPEGRYTLHLVGLEKAPPSSFAPEDGPRVKWVFHLYAESGIENMTRGERFYFNNEPYEFWRTTSTKNSPRAYARKYAEALSGRKLEEKEVPKLSGLLDARMSAMITYEDDENDSSRKVLKMSGLKHVESNGATAPTRQAEPTQVSADPSSDEIERASIMTDLQKTVKLLTKLDAAQGKAAADAVAASPATPDLADLKRLQKDIQTALEKAMDE